MAFTFLRFLSRLDDAGFQAGLGLPHHCRRAQPLSQEMPLVVRRIVEPSELLVAELLVEAGRLKAERVDPGGVTAAVARLGFRPGHQLAADTAPAQILGNPEVSNE
jgi:hypothetical protein